DHPDRCLPVVKAPSGKGGTPGHRLQAAVGVHARTGQRQQRGQMVENAGDEVVPGLAQIMVRSGIVEEIPAGLTVPEADMDMTAAADEVGERPRGEAGEQAMPERDAAHGISQLDLVIGRANRGGVPDRDLLLPRPVLVDRLFYLDALGIERGYDVVYNLSRQIQPDRGVAGRLIEWHVAAIPFLRQVELVLKGGRHGDAGPFG